MRGIKGRAAEGEGNGGPGGLPRVRGIKAPCVTHNEWDKRVMQTEVSVPAYMHACMMHRALHSTLLGLYNVTMPWALNPDC